MTLMITNQILMLMSSRILLILLLIILIIPVICIFTEADELSDKSADDKEKINEDGDNDGQHTNNIQ